MTNKLDDVARAICKSFCNDCDGDCEATPEQGGYLPGARAAILVIREPGEDVLRAVAIESCELMCGQRCKMEHDGSPDHGCIARARRAVHALVDALIGGET